MLRRHVPMLKFTSALGSDRATTEDISLTATIIRIVITTGRIGVTPITGRTTGTADIVIAIIIVIPIITGASLTGIAGLARSYFEPA